MDRSVSFRDIQNKEELNTSGSFHSVEESTFCLMIHYMPTIESLDPQLQDIYKGMRPPGTPRYGL